MTESYFMYNEDSFDACVEPNNSSNDWFDEFNSQRGQFVIRDCTVEVLDAFRTVTETVKPDPLASVATGPSAIDELIDPSSSVEPLSSQI